jgi:hypothetical protein
LVPVRKVFLSIGGMSFFLARDPQERRPGLYHRLGESCLKPSPDLCHACYTPAWS